MTVKKKNAYCEFNACSMLSKGNKGKLWNSPKSPNCNILQDDW